jgi:hypothetical protein
MSALKDLIRDNWLWLTILAIVASVAAVFFRALSRLSLDRLAKLSISTNVSYILLSLIFRKQLLPSETPAFPHLAQILIWVQFAMAGMASARVIDKLCTPNPAGETDVDNISVINTAPIATPPRTGWKSISRSDWLWAIGTDVCYIATFAVVMSLRHLTFHP